MNAAGDKLNKSSRKDQEAQRCKSTTTIPNTWTRKQIQSFEVRKRALEPRKCKQNQNDATRVWRKTKIMEKQKEVERANSRGEVLLFSKSCAWYQAWRFRTTYKRWCYYD